jgi:hypothetical protein
MESQDQRVVEDLNQSIRQDDAASHSSDKYDYGLDASFHGDASWSPFSGDVNATLTARGYSNSARDEFKSAVSSALDSQVSKTQEFRTQRVHTQAESAQIDTQTETSFKREVRNTGDSEVNFVFYQLSQEMVSLLSLVDVKVAFANGDTSQREAVSIGRLDSLLERVIPDVSHREKAKQLIVGELQSVFDYQDNPRSLLRERRLLATDGTQTMQSGAFQIDPDLRSTYELRDSEGTLKRTLEVPGIIVKAERRVLELPAIVVALLGD